MQCTLSCFLSSRPRYCRATTGKKGTRPPGGRNKKAEPHPSKKKINIFVSATLLKKELDV
jgi:hypothetical protein